MSLCQLIQLAIQTRKACLFLTCHSHRDADLRRRSRQSAVDKVTWAVLSLALLSEAICKTHKIIHNCCSSTIIMQFTQKHRIRLPRLRPRLRHLWIQLCWKFHYYSHYWLVFLSRLVAGDLRVLGSNKHEARWIESKNHFSIWKSRSLVSNHKKIQSLELNSLHCCMCSITNDESSFQDQKRSRNDCSRNKLCWLRESVSKLLCWFIAPERTTNLY